MLRWRRLRRYDVSANRRFMAFLLATRYADSSAVVEFDLASVQGVGEAEAMADAKLYSRGFVT